MWNSSRVDDDIQIPALDVFYEMDGRKSRRVGLVPSRRCRRSQEK